MVGSTAKYGAAMEQVIEYKMVTAAAEIATISADEVYFHNKDGSKVSISDSDPRKESDLWFGLRGAGGSFGIVTEFLVKVYPVPETLASVIPVWVSTADDLKLIQQAAESKQGKGYQWGLYSLYYNRAIKYPWSHPLLSLSQYLLKIQAWWSGESGIPMIISIADIRAFAGRRTNTTEVVNLLKKFGIKLAISSTTILDKVSQEAGALGMMDYEGEYLTETQRISLGPQGLVSANMGGIAGVDCISQPILEDPIFGNKNKFSTSALNVGCNYCFWALNFLTVPVRSPEDRIALTRDVGRIQMEMTCMYTLSDINSRCKQEVERLRKDVLKQSLKDGGKDSQYVNTPSCQDENWKTRYFGEANYEKLLGIKKHWDPSNLFNYCQSVGSKHGNCCQ